jgi:cation transporter-like permease
MAASYFLYLALVTVVGKLLLWPFGGPEGLGRVALAFAHIVDAALGIPMVVFVVAATLVTYAELRFREDPDTTTRALVGSLRH